MEPEVTTPTGPPPVIAYPHTYTSITEKIAGIVLRRETGRGWFVGFAIGLGLLLLLTIAIGTLLSVGIGIWGINMPVAWGFAIVNFVWWVGIGHAGTLISAILLLLRQSWRQSINRFAEAMTIFAVMCAGLFPLLHMGRPYLFYWLAPYPNTMSLWPQFRSPLVWDVFAISTYLTISTLFWYTGLIPDLATLRDRSQSRVGRVVYGFFALGWRGSARHWQRYEAAYVLLAGLATPLVVSVHTVVSFDFATAQLPGWHSTIFPPYFVAGAIFSGFAMVVTLAVPLRAVYHLEDLVTERHLQNMAKILLVTGLLVAYGYFMEAFMGWYSQNPYEQYVHWNRLVGPYGWAYALNLVCNVAIPQALWLQRVRRSPLALFVIAFFINVGMWLERFVIVVTSLHRDFLPSSWGMYYPTIWDWATMVGSFGLFLTCFFLFIRFVPMISIAEMRMLLPEEERKEEAAS
jgi:molybdopterin-containing oxidoreductase family membrane subunit